MLRMHATLYGGTGSCITARKTSPFRVIEKRSSTICSLLRRCWVVCVDCTARPLWNSAGGENPWC